MILCCGEALIDMIPNRTETGAEGFVPHAGGAIFNTAIALGRLETDVAMMTGISTDQFGQLLAQGLSESGVSTALLVRADRPTTLAFVHLVNGSATYTFYDENTAGRLLSAEELPAIPDAVNTLYFGGISLVSEPAADTYLGLAEAQAGTRVIALDPNIRPGFIRDENRYRARLAKMMAVADIVKVSDEDLAWILQRDDLEDGDLRRGGFEQAARALQAQGPKVVVVTQGANGAMAVNGADEAVYVASKRADVVDTVGAGDTFNAGFLSELAARDRLTKTSFEGLTSADLEAALDRGAQVAAVTVSRAGANPPRLNEL